MFIFEQFKFSEQMAVCVESYFQTASEILITYYVEWKKLRNIIVKKETQ